MKEQQVVVFECNAGKGDSNIGEINALMREGWRVVMMSPTSSPATSVGAYTSVFALVVLERSPIPGV